MSRNIDYNQHIYNSLIENLERKIKRLETILEDARQSKSVFQYSVTNIQEQIDVLKRLVCDIRRSGDYDNMMLLIYEQLGTDIGPGLVRMVLRDTRDYIECLIEQETDK